MNVASGVLSELMSAKMDISKECFEMFTSITVRFKLQSIVFGCRTTKIATSND